MKDTKSAQAYADSTLKALQPLIEREPLKSGWYRMLGFSYAISGRKEEAIRAGRKAVELLPVSKDAWDGPNILWGLAVVYTIVGEHDAAIDQLANLFSISGRVGPDYRIHPVWDPLREHPRFKALLKEYSEAQR